MNDATDGQCSWSEDTFQSQGTHCAVRVYRPTDARATPVPVIVMAHGFGAVRALRLYAYAEEFATAGYAVAVFDYRGFGDSAGEPRQLLDVRMQHQDWRAAIRYARTLQGVDANQGGRVGNVLRWWPRHQHRRTR